MTPRGPRRSASSHSNEAPRLSVLCRPPRCVPKEDFARGMKGVLLLGLLLALPTAQAQTIYRCGNTISQTPCGPDAQVRQLPSAGPKASAPAALKGQALCTEFAIQHSATPDPASARVSLLQPRRAEVIRYADQPVTAYRYDLSIDVKTAQGLYIGPQRYSCWLSEDQLRLLQMRVQP